MKEEIPSMICTSEYLELKFPRIFHGWEGIHILSLYNRKHKMRFINKLRDGYHKSFTILGFVKLRSCFLCIYEFYFSSTILFACRKVVAFHCQKTTDDITKEIIKSLRF